MQKIEEAYRLQMSRIWEQRYDFWRRKSEKKVS